jgi:hypothetical protein
MMVGAPHLLTRSGSHFVWENKAPSLWLAECSTSRNCPTSPIPQLCVFAARQDWKLWAQILEKKSCYVPNLFSLYSGELLSRIWKHWDQPPPGVESLYLLPGRIEGSEPRSHDYPQPPPSHRVVIFWVGSESTKFGSQSGWALQFSPFRAELSTLFAPPTSRLGCLLSLEAQTGGLMEQMGICPAHRLQSSLWITETPGTQRREVLKWK